VGNSDNSISVNTILLVGKMSEKARKKRKKKLLAKKEKQIL
jgi:hypothetical protein